MGITQRSLAESKPEYYNGRGTLALIRVMELESLAQKFGPQELFNHLRTIEATARTGIQEAGGMVAGDLTTGLMAFFGWNSNRTVEPLAHVTQAFESAEALQCRVADYIKSNSGADQPVFLLQIALATGFYYVNRNARDNSELSAIIGQGVNLAGKIIDYCGIKSIILNEECERILNQAKPHTAKKHEIKIKHPQSSVIINCFEYNTFHTDVESYRIITNKVRSSINRRYDPERWQCIESPILVEVLGNHYQLLNISRGGIEIEGPEPHLNGQIVEVTFDSPDGILGICAQKLDLSNLSCEVRWNKQRHGKFNIGLMFVGLEPERREELVSLVLSNTQKKLGGGVN
jgi:hypothetical protein